MRSQRDQVQAHQFVVRRLRTGLLRDDPENPDPPTSRTVRGLVIGLVVALLAGLVVVIYGMVVPGGATGWRKPGTLVLVRGTGTRLLYLGGELHPVLNLASARLLLGTALTVEVVEQKSLAGTPFGAPLGIVGAPDSLPAPASLTRDAWLTCATVTTGPTGKPEPRTVLGVGLGRRGRALESDSGVLVVGPDDGTHLLWRGKRLRVDAEHGALAALGYADADPFPVSAAVLAALPPGPDLGAPAVPGAGSAGPDLSGAPSRVGRLYAGPGGSAYLLRAEGLVPLSGIELSLVRGDPRTQQAAYGGGPVVVAPIGPEDVAGHRAPGETGGEDRVGALPGAPPSLVPVGRGEGVCAEARPTDGAASTAVTVITGDQVRGVPPTAEPGVLPACVAVDEVAVPPGGGALVRPLSAADVPGTALFLISDSGRKHAVDDSAKQLGYTATDAVPVPAALLAALPTGPVLSAARIAASGLVAPPPATRTCG